MKKSFKIKAGFIVLVFTASFFALVSNTYAEQSSFSRNLKIGDTGIDVFNLQKILNSDQETRLTAFGVGSPGNETYYFGNLTKVAVAKFQQKYASEVLNPLGLYSGTGFVGPSTRVKLNSLSSLNEVHSGNTPMVPEIPSFPSIPSFPAPETTPIPVPSPENPGNQQSLIFGEDIFSQTDDLLVAFISSYEGEAGSQVSIAGSGFKPEGNTVKLGNQISIPNLSSENSYITFNIPEDTPPGIYDINVSNSQGVSEHSAAFFVVTNPGASKPVINSITPEEGPFGTRITISGENFTSTGNQIRSSYGIIENIPSSDGETLKFDVEPFPDDLSEESEYHWDWDIYFHVVNSNGISQDPGVFKLKI